MLDLNVAGMLVPTIVIGGESQSAESRSPLRAPVSLPANWSCRSHARPSFDTDGTRRESKTAALPCTHKSRRRWTSRTCLRGRTEPESAESSWQNGSARLTWATMPLPKNVLGRWVVRSMNWSGTTKMTGRDFRAQTAHRADRDNSLDAQFLHGENIGAKINFRGQPAVAIAVARQKDEIDVAEFAALTSLSEGLPNGVSKPRPRRTALSPPSDTVRCRRSHRSIGAFHDVSNQSAIGATEIPG